MRKYRAGLLILILGLYGSVFSDDGAAAGFDFLRWDTGARVSAMGSAYTAARADLAGANFNPAVLYGSSKTGCNLSYYRYPLDIQAGYVGFYKQFTGGSLVAFSLAYVNYGTMSRTNAFNDNLGTFGAGSVVVSALYSDSTSLGFIWGGTVKYITSKLADYTSSAAAIDLGLIYPVPSQQLRFGLSVSNIGMAISSYIDKKEKLPLTFRAGLAKQLAHLPLLLHVDLIHYVSKPGLQEKGLYWAIGGEFEISDHFYLRWGYNSRGLEQRRLEGGSRFAGFSAGLGIYFRNWTLDCGWGFHGVLGDVPSVTFSSPL